MNWSIYEVNVAMTNEEIGLWEKPEKSAKVKDIKNGARIANETLKDSSLAGARAIELFKKYPAVYEWVTNNIGEIARMWKGQFGSETIILEMYFIELRTEVHDCIQIKFGFDNVILNVRQRRGADYGACFTCPLVNKTSPEERVDIYSPSLNIDGILDQFYSEFMYKLPLRQLKSITEVYPISLSEFGPAGWGPQLTVDLRFREGSGMYAKLFVDQKERYRSYSYQPVYADHEREICTLIVRPEECLDIEETIGEIERAACPDYAGRAIKLLSRVEIEIEIEEALYANMIAAYDIRAIKFGGIDDNIVKRQIYGAINSIKVAESSAISAVIKGKDKADIPNDVYQQLSSMQEVAEGMATAGERYPISSSDFGFSEKIIYGNPLPIDRVTANKFQNRYLKFRRDEIRKVGD